MHPQEPLLPISAPKEEVVPDIVSVSLSTEPKTYDIDEQKSIQEK